MKKKSNKIIKADNSNTVKKPLNNFFKKFGGLFLIPPLAVAATVVGLGAVPTQPLPEKPAVYKSLEKNNVGAEYLSILDNYAFNKVFRDDEITRLPLPNNMDYFKINVCFETNDKQKQVFQKIFDEYNEIFSVINPKYKFKLNFEPTLLDRLSPYAINYTSVNGFGKKGTLARTTNINLPSQNDGDGVLFNNIKLKKTLWENEKIATVVIKHEFMHALGVGDAYLQRESINSTIMQRIYEDFANSRFRKADIAYIAALYLDKDCKLTEQELMDYINNYEDNYIANEISQVLSNLDYKTFISKISEASINSKDKYRLIKSLDDNNYTSNINFGTTETILYEVDGSNSSGALVRIKDGNLKTAYSTSSYQQENSVWVKNGFIFNKDFVFVNFGEYVVSFEYNYHIITEEFTIKPESMKFFKLADTKTATNVISDDSTLSF